MSTPERINNAELTARLLAQAQVPRTQPLPSRRSSLAVSGVWGGAVRWAGTHVGGVVLTYLGAHPVKARRSG